MKEAAPAGAAPARTIPGLRGWQLVRALPALKKQPHEFLLRLATRFGGITDMPFPFERVVFVSDPASLEYIFHHNYANYTKSTGRWRAFSEVIGNGILTVDGQQWRRQRQRMQPAFHPDRIPLLESVVERETVELLDRWEHQAGQGRPVNVMPDMLRLNFRILAGVMFSRDVKDVLDPVIAAFQTAHRFINPFTVANLLDPPRIIRRLLSPGYGQFARARKLLDDTVYRIIEERVRSGEDAGDMLSMLILSRDEEVGEVMKSPQVRDEVMSVFMAGHETTSIALTWTLYLLSRHPEIEARLQQELSTTIGEGPVAVADLPKLTYAKLVLEESMRLYPPAWGLDRRAVEEDVVGGFRVPAGSTVAFSPYVTHRLPAYWHQPDVFDPLRFTEERSAGRPMYAYFPFGGGARRCSGHRFATIQMLTILARVLRRFKLDLVPGPEIGVRPVINLMPKQDVLMTVTRRAR